MTTPIKPGVRRELAALLARWPVGARVQHSSGWTGRVAADTSGEHLGHVIGQMPAHAVVGILPVVHVVPDPPELVPMWMNAGLLTRLGDEIRAEARPARTRRRDR